MKIAGILEPGIKLGVVTESKYVRSGYIVIQSRGDLSTIPEGVLVKGTPIFIAEEDKLVRFSGGDISSPSSWKEEATLTPADVENISTEIEEKLSLKQDQLVSGETIKTIEGISILGSGDISLDKFFEGYATEQWVLDKNYLTEHQDISHLETKEDAQKKLEESKGFASSEISKASNTLLNKIEGVEGELDKAVEDISLLDSRKADKSELPSIEGLASEQFVNDEIAKIISEVEAVEAKIPTKVSQLENDKGYLTSHQSLEEYYKKSEVESLLEGKANVEDIPSVEGLATEEFVTESIKNVESKLPTKTSQLSNDSGFITSEALSTYATKTYVAEEIAKVNTGGDIDLEGYATEQWVKEQGFLTEHQSLEGYAKITDIPDVSGFITSIPAEYITETELEGYGYAKKSDIPDVSKFITEVPAEYITEEELSQKGYITEHQDISGKADISYVDEKFNNIVHPDYEEYDDTEVRELISGKADKDHKHSLSDISDYVEPDLKDYAKKTDIPDVSKFITEVPSEYITEEELEAKGYITDISGKVDKVEGKQLSTEDFTTELKSKLESLENYDDGELAAKVEDLGKEKAEKEHKHTLSDITDYVAPKIPTKLSELENDEGFITSIPDTYITEDKLNGKGYLTSVPEEYAKKTDIPDVSEFVTAEDVSEELTNYVTREELEDIEIELPTEWDADKVGFSQDLIFTREFGKYVPDSSGSVTIPTKTNTMSLQDLLLDAFSEEKNPTTTQPSITLGSSNIGAKEVGTKIQVKFAYSDETAGSYTYGPATGVTWSEHKATFNGETITGKSGTFKEIQVTDSTSLSISGSAKHSAGAIPLTNLGNEFTPETVTDTSGAIQEKTVSKSKGTLSGYRQAFLGTMENPPETMTSSDIRGLATKFSVAATTKDITIPVNAKRVVLAVPSAWAVTKCLDVNGFNTDLIATGGMSGPITVYVKGANDYVTTDAPNGIAYDVWYQNFANPNDTKNTYKVTIAKG